ncbi:MAG: hypothetical protein K0U86_22700 [Planctomycetes bacterium]|nr:hypothetical protein [Planctomycetota bacterium]MCH9727720.1 hypothetical protein [Planctomycetota bacterium]MCH9776955.1 hypothetical protein [Planctomycetota bacterium]MDF1743630.1 hypothetical protein [Gimesia sp.]
MSSINPGAVNLSSSFAGAQRSDASADKQKAEAAQQNMSIDKKTMTEHQLQDVGDTDKSGDRDADGRMPFGHDEAEEQGTESSDQTREEDPSARAPDTTGKLGTHLDLDA